MQIWPNQTKRKEKNKLPLIDDKKKNEKIIGGYTDNPNSDNPEVIATHTAQYLAQLKVDRSQKRVFLYRYKPVPYQADNEFYKYLTKMN